jgi:2-dehydro-3-deoxygalactonokinase
MESARQIPILACGMIGSKQGLLDAGYSPCPTSPAALAAHLIQSQCGRFKLWIIPGLRMPSAPDVLPDFMRGEETQVLGANLDGLFVLPGSHSKWIDVDQGIITRFETHFSGELFAVLKEHSILGRLFAASSIEPIRQTNSEQAFDPVQSAAFLRGISTARKHPQQLLQHLFSTRALGLEGQLTAASGESFLSGLLIGHEICAALSHRGKISEVRLVGSPQLCARYAQALEFFNIKAHSLGNTSARGLWRLGQSARLF